MTARAAGTSGVRHQGRECPGRHDGVACFTCFRRERDERPAEASDAGGSTAAITPLPARSQTLTSRQIAHRRAMYEQCQRLHR
jgi:hypothetical protein